MTNATNNVAGGEDGEGAGALNDLEAMLAAAPQEVKGE